MTARIPTVALLDSIIEVLARLAAPADLQIEYLTRLGVAPLIDELALEFDDIFKPLAHRIDGRPGWKNALASLRELDSSLDSDQLPWTIDDLRESRDWEEIRRLATSSEELVRDAIAGDPGIRQDGVSRPVESEIVWSRPDDRKAGDPGTFRDDDQT